MKRSRLQQSKSRTSAISVLLQSMDLLSGKSLICTLTKSFHTDTYCFDSKSERECFLQYISSNKVKEIYFTGMFTSNQGDLSVQYYDPESKRLRKYYPDFLALMEDDSYQLIEVKGDNKIDDEVVLAKKEAAYRRFLRLPAKICNRNQDGMVAAGTAVIDVSVLERIFAT